MVRLDIDNKTLIIKQKGVKSNLEKEWRIILNEIKNIYSRKTQRNKRKRKKEGKNRKN